MKIEEDDLVRLFEEDELGLTPEDDWIEPKKEETVKVKKPLGKTDELDLKKVRRHISSIKEKHKAKSRKLGFTESFLRFTFVSGLLGFVIFIGINYPSYFKQLKWAYYTDYLGKSLPETSDLAASPTPTPKPSPIIDYLAAPEALPELNTQEGNYLKIQKIGVEAPIIWDVEENNILENLKRGVVHYKGTSRPGEGGNIFIVGHSSNYFWIKSDYNQIFALLDKLVNGDRIEARRGSRSYFYDVTDKKTVSPRQVEVLNSVGKETLTLMTCWPIGTNLNRLIIQAEFKYSD